MEREPEAGKAAEEHDVSIDCEEQNLRPLPFRVSGVTKPGSEPPPRHSVGIDKTIQQRKEQPHEASDQTKD